MRVLCVMLPWALVCLATACGSEEARLGELVDACLDRESMQRRELLGCQDALSAAEAAISGEGQDGPTPAAPLLPMRARVRTRTGEDPVLEFDARSSTHKGVHSFRFRARLYNAFDELVPCDPSENEYAVTCPLGAEEYRDEIEETVEPRRSERVQRPLPDFERVTKAIVTIYEVTFEDRSTWHGSATGFPAPPVRSEGSQETPGGEPPPIEAGFPTE